jgi:hypothetical protein
VKQGRVDRHRERGVSVVHVKCDLTSFESSQRAYDEITGAMPPIGGVANGAMILRDSTIVQLPFDDLNLALSSKVKSTVNLDRLFSTPSKTLDWFICFSSIVATIGNLGQGAYAAGNFFMKTLVRRRRRQGMCGCTIDISRVLGLGFIERESQGRLTHAHQTRLKEQSGTLAIGETDLHQLFAEAIISGRSDSGLEPDIITGLAPVRVETAPDAFWLPNPRFGLIIREREGAGANAAGGDRINAVPPAQLLRRRSSY